jgi:hypothetical protein
MGDIPTPAPAPNPGDLLLQLQQQLAAAEAQNADLAKNMARFKQQIAELAKSVSDAAQKTLAWGKALPAFAQHRRDILNHISLVLPVIDAAVTNKSEIVNAKNAGEKELADLAKAVADALGKEQQRHQEWQDARDATETRRQAYDHLAGIAAANDLLFKDLEVLRAAAEKARAANEFSLEYFWILNMEDVVAQLRLPTVTEYTNQLNDATSDLAQASGKERVAKDAEDQAASLRKQTEKQLADARTTARARVAAGIVEHDVLPTADGVHIAPAATGDGGGGATTGTGDGAG